MKIKKLLIVGAVASLFGLGTLINTTTQETFAAAPASYDLRVAWYYNARAGSTQLWAHTTSGGGITIPVYWAQESTYWRSYLISSFFASEFNFEIRIARSVDNDALFTFVSAGKYLYSSPDNTNISYYNVPGQLNQRMRVNVLNADYFVSYKRDVNTSTYTYYHPFGLPDHVYNYSTVSKTDYEFQATFGMSTYIYNVTQGVAGSLQTYTSAYYFKLNAAANIEGQDWWDIYNAGVNNGYSAGLETGYASGLDAGRLENTAWDDAFTIIKGAVDTVGDVMGIQLFGPVTIGTLVSIPLIVGLLFWIIDKWRGS